MECVDSRRLTGRNLQWERPGAVLEVRLEENEADAAIRRWERTAARLLRAVGWDDERTCVRRYAGGASLAISAPFDALYAACEVNEAAWEIALARDLDDDGEPDAETLERLRAAIEAEQRPALARLRDEAIRHGVAFLADDERVSIGLGRGSRTWEVEEVPDPAAVDWSQIHDIPVALITGTNGKTTTVRMLAAIARAAGLVAANTSTDGVQIDATTVLAGDYTGPEGARALLRDRRVEIAFLEAARGGLLRRGLPLERADAACVTNVGHDHFGEYGIDNLESVAAVKLLVAEAVPSGRAVINADDPVLFAAARERRLSPTWFSLASEPAGLADGEPLWQEREEVLGRRTASGFDEIIPVAEVPATIAGLARHNVANALAAAGVAGALGLPDSAIAAGLRTFRSDPSGNPGRGNLIEIGGVRSWVDFAHNPEGLRAIVQFAEALGPRRTLLILGQAGDRDDASIDALAEIGAGARPDRIVLKEMRKYLRGRREGEVVARIRRRLLECGYPEGRIQVCSSEMESVRSALRWAQPGDLLLLLLHSDRERVLKLLGSLDADGWSPGAPLPVTEPETPETDPEGEGTWMEEPS